MSEAKYIKGEWKARGGGGPYEVGERRYVIPPHIVDEYTDEQGRKVTVFVASSVNELDYAKFIVRACNNFDALLAACKEAQCACTLRQRDSGHRVGCWMPDLLEAIAAAEGEGRG